MPANFTAEEKEKLTQDLLNQGYALLSSQGMKKLKIRDVAKTVGIGTGTFYHFFSSKEAFIYALIQYRKRRALEKFEQLASQYPKGIPFEETKKYFLQNLSTDNIYRLFSQQDYDQLISKLNLSPHAYKVIEASGMAIMPRLKTKKGLADFKLFTEAYRIIVIGTSDLSKLDAALIPPVLDSLVDAACRFLY